MNLKKVKRSEIDLNPQNPRTITEVDRAKMVTSLLSFPEMMFIRPIVIGSDGITMGGNQRLEGTITIRDYDEGQKAEIFDDERILRKRAGHTPEQLEKFEEAMEFLLYGEEFYINDISFLAPDKQEEFIIKDNVPFGSWDWEAVESLWGKEKVTSWGLEVPKWIEPKQETNDEREITEDDVHTEHTCPKCGFEFN